MKEFKVRVNGTKEYLYGAYGLKCNPFPQVAKHEYSKLNSVLMELEKPIKDKEHLLKILKGGNKEFVELCLRYYEPGKVTEFIIKLPE